MQGPDGFEYLVPCARSKKALLERVTKEVESQRAAARAEYAEKVDTALSWFLAVTQDAVDRSRAQRGAK